MASNIELCDQNSHPRDRLCDTLHPRHRERSAAILRRREIAAAPKGPRNDEAGYIRRCSPALSPPKMT